MALSRYSAAASSVDAPDPPLWMPKLFSLGAVAGPIPWNLPTGSGSTNASPISGVMTYWPFGLRWSEASFARNLLGDAGRCVEFGLLLDHGADASATFRASGIPV